MRQTMIDHDFATWSNEFNQLVAARHLDAVDSHVQRFLYDDGLDPDEAAQASRIARYRQKDRPRPASASVAQVLAQKYGPSDAD